VKFFVQKDVTGKRTKGMKYKVFPNGRIVLLERNEADVEKESQLCVNI
jgi:hypothetical protein